MVDRREAIKSAFLDSLRTVVMIDDQFPSYEELCKEKPEHRREIARAQSLWTGFRGHGLACEVENDVLKLPPGQDLPEYILKCDLIILDYHLSDTNDEGKAARGMLRKLLKNAQPHLVILYTAHTDLQDVWLRIAASLMGRPTENMRPWEPGQEEDDEEQYNELLKKNPLPDSDFLGYLQRKDITSLELTKNLSREYKNAEKARKIVERLSHARAIDLGADYEPSSERRLQASRRAGHWLRCDNLFIAIVKKNDDSQAQSNEAAFLREQLLNALVDWDPSFLRIIFDYARHRITTQGLDVTGKVIRGGEDGLLHYMLEGSEAEQRERRRKVYAGLFEEMVDTLLEEMEHLYSEIASQQASEAQERGDHAKILIDERNTIRLNAFLASQDRCPHYLKTGTVFQIENDLSGNVGICVSPECDLVPREGGNKLTAVIWWKAKLITESKAKTKAAEQATHADYLFLTGQDQKSSIAQDLVIQIRESKHSIPKPEMLFVTNGGRIQNGTFSAHQLSLNDEGHPTCGEAIRFKVLGQLRESYASKLLHDVGHHLSRIGVDFVNLRKPKS